MTVSTVTPTIAGHSILLYPALARLRDLVLAVILLLLLSPLLGLVVVLVRLTSRGPAIFKQVRVGYDGAHFTMYKFRTMREGASESPHRELVSQLITSKDQSPPAVESLSSDDRVTMVGRYLRRYSLDELPQLANVLRNEMSLVGPRPGLPYEVELYDDTTRERLSVKPGLTGLWQVSGRKGLGMHDMFELDRQYVSGRTLRGDFGILVRTLQAVVRRSGAW